MSSLLRVVFDPDTIPPGTPTIVSVVAVGQNRLDITWTPVVDTGGAGLAGYNVLKDGATTIALGIQTVYSDTGLATGSSHTYRVQARDAASPTPNTSPFSPQVAGTTASAPGVFNPDYPRRFSYAIGGTQNASNAALAARSLNIFSYGATWPQRKGIQLEAKVQAVKALSTVGTKMVPYVILTDVQDSFGVPGANGQDYYQWYKALTDNFWFVYTNGLTHATKVVGSGSGYSKPNYTLSCPVVAGDTAATYKTKYDYALLYSGGQFNTGASTGNPIVTVQGTQSLDGKFDDNIFIRERSAGDYNVDGTSEAVASAANITLVQSSFKANLEYWRTVVGTGDGTNRLELCNFADWMAYGGNVTGTPLDQLYDGGVHENITEYYEGPRGTTAASLFNALKVTYDGCKGPKLTMLRVQLNSATDYQRLRFWDAVSCLIGGGMYEHFVAGYPAEELGTLNWDERDIKLGQPVAGSAGAVQFTAQAGGHYRRDFANGIVVVNPTANPLTVSLGGTFYKLLGSRSPTINNGATVTSVTIPASDALFLMRVTQDSIPPSAPTGLAASAVSSSTINLSWNASTDTGGSGLAGYRVERSLSSTSGFTDIGVQPTTPSYSDTGRSASTTYYYRVRSVDGAGTFSTTYSNVGNATTLAASGGGLAHGDTFTVTGSGFGSKSGSSPLVWDPVTAAAGTIDSQWSGAWPNGYTSTNAQYNTQIRNSGYRSITGPHQFNTKFYGGCHFDQGDAFSGRNVMLYKAFTAAANEYSYWHYYTLFDPNWKFGNNAANGNGGTNDNNIKTYDYATSTSPYPGPTNFYLQFTASAGTTANGFLQASGNDDDGSLQIPDGNGRNINFGTGAMSDISDLSPWLAWRKWEIEIKWSGTNNGGYIRQWMNNRLVFDYLGSTDKYPGTDRNESIGGYSRNRDPNEYRYFCDIAFDRQVNSASRFVLTNNATYASSTIVEYQRYTAWSGGSVALVCNRGALPAGAAHLHFRCPVNGNQYLGTKTLA